MDIKKTFNDFVNEGKFDGIADLVKSLHFETDPKTAEEKKIAIGKSQGEFNKKKQIEGGEYSLRRFRKEIKFGDGTYLGVFLPGSYDAATSTLGDGPHKKAVKKIKWTQKKYDQWLEDMSANGGADNAFDMAQNAKNEPGLIDWVKKEFRGDDALQRIQWDIEAFVESVVTEAKFDKKKLMKAMKADDGMIQLANGEEYVIYAYDNGNDENDAMWNDKSIFALDQDGEEHEVKYSDIVSYNESAVNEAEQYITDEFKVGDKIKTGFGEWEVIETDYAPKKSFMGSFIFKGKDMKRVNIPNPPKTNKNAVGYKVTDGNKYPIIGFLYQYKDITKLVTVDVDESVVNEASEDRMIKQIERALKDGTSIFKLPMATQNYYNKNKGTFESVVTEAKNTIGLAFKEEQDYLDFKEFVAEQPRGAIRKNIGFDSKTKSWNVEMDVKVLDSIYGEGTSGNKESGWYGGLPDDFESVIIESVVTEEVAYNSSNTKPEAAKKATKEFGKLLPKANKGVEPYVFAVVKTKARNYRLAIKSGSYVAHEFMSGLKEDGILTADIVKKAVANVIKLNPEEFNESAITESKNEVNDKQLANLQKDIAKINKNIKVYISTHPVTKGKLSIELGADHNNEDEIDQINGLLKKHTGDHKTGTMFNEAVITESKSEFIKIDSYLNTKDESVLIDFLDDAYGNSDDRKTRKEWNDARKDLSYNELVDYAVAHAENFGMDLQDIEDAIEVYESLVTEAKDMTFADYLEVLDVKFEDAMAAVKGENGSDAEIKPTRGDILQNFTLFRNYVSSLTKKYKGDKTRLRFLTECVNEYIGIINESVVNEGKGAENYFDDLKYNYTKSLRHLDKDEKKEYNKLAKDFFSKISESVVNEGKIKYSKGKTYQSDGHWTVYVDSNSSGFDIRVNHSAGWRLDPQDVREETIQLLDNGRQKATLNFKSGNIDKFAQQMFDLNDRTTNGNQTKLTAKDYADIIRVWIDMKMANESVVNEAKLNRAEITDFIEKHVKFVRTTEEFDGSEGGIWVSGESNDKYKGKIIYDYYSEDHKTREFGVLNNWEKELNKLGWYSEWYDAGTVMIWEI